MKHTYSADTKQHLRVLDTPFQLWCPDQGRFADWRTLRGDEEPALDACDCGEVFDVLDLPVAHHLMHGHEWFCKGEGHRARYNNPAVCPDCGETL